MSLRARRKLAFRPSLVIGMPWQLSQRRQILGHLWVMEFIATKPAPLKPMPEQDGIHLPRKFIDAPRAIPLDLLAGRIEWQAIQFADGIDPEPMFADVDILQRHMIRLLRIPSLATSSFEKSTPLHQEFGQPGNAVCQSPGFIGGQLAGPDAVARFVIAAEYPRQRNPIGVLHLIAVTRCLHGRPWRRKSAFLVA
jgi:hypothetical protein